jgi:hypothetical protein
METPAAGLRLTGVFHVRDGRSCHEIETPRPAGWRAQERVLGTPRWRESGFTLWGAGRDGRQVLGLLRPRYRAAVRAFCDIDPAKIARGYTNPE